MIKVTIIRGLHAGRTRTMPHDVNPEQLFREFISVGMEWVVDYTRATPEEIYRWGVQDMFARSVRAILRGLPVKFMGKEYRGFESLAQLEDDIVASNKMVALVRDDENGVVIATGDWVQ